MIRPLRRPFTLVLCVALAFSCTAIRVEPLGSSSARSRHVCIERNSAVVLADFLDTVRAGFERHGISTEVYEGPSPSGCELTVTYTARQSWDIVTFLSHAEIRIFQSGRQVGYAQYHLRGKGGYALTKYRRTATKMRPVMDRLLEDFRDSPPGAPSGPG